MTGTPLLRASFKSFSTFGSEAMQRGLVFVLHGPFDGSCAPLKSSSSSAVSDKFTLTGLSTGAAGTLIVFQSSITFACVAEAPRSAMAKAAKALQERVFMGFLLPGQKSCRKSSGSLLTCQITKPRPGFDSGNQASITSGVIDRLHRFRR